MSHTSLDSVGTIFSYDGNRYGGIGNAILAAPGRSFRNQFADDIADPLGINTYRQRTEYLPSLHYCNVNSHV
jgi:hypothetical protein